MRQTCGVKQRWCAVEREVCAVSKRLSQTKGDEEEESKNLQITFQAAHIVLLYLLTR